MIGGLPRLATSAPSAAQDAEVLDFALRARATAGSVLRRGAALARPSPESWASSRASSAATSAPTASSSRRRSAATPSRASEFDFGDTLSDTKSFLDAAVALEETAVAAYNGQATNLTPKALASAATDRLGRGPPRLLGEGARRGGAGAARIGPRDRCRTARKTELTRPGWWRNEPRRPARRRRPAASRWSARPRRRPAREPRSGSRGATRAACCEPGRSRRWSAALALAARRAGGRPESRRRRAQLRALARVPAGRVLHRGRAPEVRSRASSGSRPGWSASHERAHVEALQALLGGGGDQAAASSTSRA